MFLKCFIIAFIVFKKNDLIYLLSKFFSHSCVTLPELKANLIEFVQDLIACHLQGVLWLDALK